ncbi:DUF6287 domain-containing protein [Streptococcus timonensis]|uniref:DUF6287 domain-containing protein n=1 Tax=Streptococcus timonensis TaxID=1852387 RepID=UPI0039C17596
MKIGKIIKRIEDTVYIGYNNGSFQKSAIENCEFEPKIGDIVHIYEDLVVKLEAKNAAFTYKPKHKIISIEDGLARIQLNTGDELTIPIREMNFQPKLNELVEIYQDDQEIIVLQSKEKGINWLLLMLCSLIPIALISSLFLFNHKKQDTEAVNATTELVSTTSTTATSTITTSSTTTQDSVTTTEEKPSTQEEQTNAESQKIDEQAILNGDFSTLVGTWRNGLGKEFTFDKNGLVDSGNIEKVSIGNDGSINFSIRAGFSGYGMSVYPAGTTMKWVDSDSSKNRLIAGQAAPTSSEQVFYKVD